MNSWDEMNLNSIQGVYVDDSIGASTSPATAISHPPQAGGDPELFQLRENSQCREQHQKWLQLRVRHQRACRKLHWQLPFLVCPTNSSAIECKVAVPDYGGPKKRDTDASIIDKWLQPTQFRSWKISFRSEVSHSSQKNPEPISYGLVKLRMLKVLTISLPRHLLLEDQFQTSIILDFKIAGGLRKILTSNFEKQISTAEGKAQSERDHLRTNRLLG